MNDSKISTRYGRALFVSARDKNLLNPVRADMEMILVLLHDLPELKQVVESPVIRSSKKDEIIKLIFRNKINDLTLSFLEMIISKKREEFLAGMARAYIKYFKEEAGIKIAMIRTAVSISDDLRKQLINIIRNAYHAEVELSEEVHEHLIGGFVLTIEDQQLDASVSGQLKKIRKELSGVSMQKR
jgi:F-type H+-transporting ATPase subunit delta